MQTVRIKNNGNRFIEQYEWTIGVCITVQIGERGTFMDVQIGERGKQRVKGPESEMICKPGYSLLSKVSGFRMHKKNPQTKLYFLFRGYSSHKCKGKKYCTIVFFIIFKSTIKLIFIS